jgi:hypothetical protein
VDATTLHCQPQCPKLLDWQRFAGPFGKRVIKHALNFFPKNPVDLIYHSVAFMKYWAGSHVTAEASQLRRADALVDLAAGAAKRRTGATGASNIPRLAARFDGDMEIDAEESEDADKLGE